MQQASTLRFRGRVTTLLDPNRVGVTEQATHEGVVVRLEKPRDDEFWMEVSLSEEWLRAKLAEIRQARHEIEREASRRRAAVVMSAWTPGREFA